MRLFCPIFQQFDETRNLKLTAKKGKVISLSDTFKIQEEALTIIEHGHYRCPGLTAAVKTRGNRQPLLISKSWTQEKLPNVYGVSNIADNFDGYSQESKSIKISKLNARENLFNTLTTVQGQFYSKRHPKWLEGVYVDLFPISRFWAIFLWETVLKFRFL